MNVNFGLFPDLDARDGRGRPYKGRERKARLASRALAAMRAWACDPPPGLAAE
jgi:methylenetetrahydrofolate--tRNA-(uracil-5-)-methyltransferase